MTRNDDNGINDSGSGTVWRGNVANRNGAVGLRNDGADQVDAGGNRARGNGEQRLRRHPLPLSRSSPARNRSGRRAGSERPPRNEPCPSVAACFYDAPVSVRVHLCGRLQVEWDGERLEGALPGRQGRMLFAFLTLHRERLVRRDELVAALWSEDGSPSGGDELLRPPLSRLRSALGAGRLEGRGELAITFPD